MIYKLMILCWKIDDFFPFWTPFCWVGNWLEDYGWANGELQFNKSVLDEIKKCKERNLD